MIKWIDKILQNVLSFFGSGRAQKDVTVALNFVAEALPYLEWAAEITTSLIPNKMPKLVLDGIKLQYPHLFDGSILTGDELKSYLLSVAASYLKADNPILTMSQAVLAVQMAYVDAKARGVAPKIPEPPAPDGILLKVKRERKSICAI